MLFPAWASSLIRRALAASDDKRRGMNACKTVLWKFILSLTLKARQTFLHLEEKYMWSECLSACKPFNIAEGWGWGKEGGLKKGRMEQEGGKKVGKMSQIEQAVEVWGRKKVGKERKSGWRDKRQSQLISVDKSNSTWQFPWRPLEVHHNIYRTGKCNFNCHLCTRMHTTSHTHMHPFNGPLSRTTYVSR